jgi:ubiquinone/menaquinone biosynthesis C-methylase UbiE
MSKVIEAFSDYNDYIEYEWKFSLEDPRRAEAMLKATSGVEVRRVLDIGCGAGQEMLPFIKRGASGVGVDITPEVGQVGRKMYAKEGLLDQISFLRGSGNELPFASETFNVLICRGALMFMNNKRALAEMSRVLQPGGLFFLMYQAAPYYWWKVRHGITSGNILSSVHAGRVLFAGNMYLLTGKQPFNKLTAGGEIFQSKSSLEREINPLGLKIIGEMPDTNPQTPSFIIAKNH